MTDAVDRRSVFVVHGRNETLRRSMFEFLRSINLAPIEWSSAVEMTGEGSPYIGQVLDVAFENAAAIVVLMTPDEVAYLQQRYAHSDHDPETEPAPQARPNVLFEAGMALGRDAKRTVLVEIGTIRPFSDIAGRHAVRLSNDVRHRQELAKRLETAGCDVNLTGSDWHTSGDFSAPPEPGGGLPLGRRVPSNTAARPLVDFDLKYINKGGSRIDKLQVINRGTESAFDVALSIPENAGLNLHDKNPLPKIPGGGKSVTIDVMSHRYFMGNGGKDNAFDVTVTARTASGDPVSQDVFIDLNS